VVELALREQGLRLPQERALGRGEFFGESRSLHVVGAGGTCLGVFDSLLDLLKVAKDGTDAHLVKSKDVVAVNQHEEF